MTNKTRNIVITALAVCFIGGAIFLFIAKPAQLFNKSSDAAKKSVSSSIEKPTISLKASLPIQISIHEGHGHIVEGYKASENPDKVIIHIQDIHTNYEAQKNEANIIEALIKEKGLKLIMVEGGWGDVSLSYLRTQADKERRVEVAEEYLKEGKISGEEYLNIVSDYDMDLQGIEEEALYRKNLDIFFKIESFREEGSKEIAQLNSVVNALKQQAYPSTLLDLEKARADYDEENTSLLEYYDYLGKAAKQAQVNTAGLSTFESFMKVAAAEKTIDFAKVEKQRAALIEKLSKALAKEKLTPLVAKSLEFRLNKITPAEYHLYLKQTAEEAGAGFKDYAELSVYIEYIKSHEEINTNILFKEADLLEEQVEEALAKTEEQKKLRTLTEVLKILDNFLNLKLIPEDFKYYKEHSLEFVISSWIPFLKDSIIKYKVKEVLPADVSVLDSNLSALTEFYDVANQRDDIFVEKALSLMDAKQQKIAVLIAGGFHTPSLTKKLKDRNISYIVIAPKTTQKTDPDQYRYILEYKSGKTE